MTRSALLIVATGALVLATAGVVYSARAPQSEELARLNAEYRDELARARRLRAEAAQAAEDLVSLDAQLVALRGEEAADDLQMEAQRARLKELGEREAHLLAQMSREGAAQGRLLSALQMMSRKPPPPLLVPAERARDTVRANIMIRAMTPEIQKRTSVLVERQEEINRIRRLAALSSEKLFTVESAQNQRRAEIENLTARKTALRAVLRAEASRAERATAALEARIREVGGAVPSVDDRPAETVSRHPAGRERLVRPLQAVPAQKYGQGSVGWRWQAANSTVSAPAPGRVLFAGQMREWGEIVILDLGPGWRAVLAGMDNVDVEVGQRVAEGQVLGRTGDDGEAYFELRRGERPIDPAPWMD
ncbi:MULTISPECIES: murein hydrolase activator EnvC family protein [unclassified Brevundimonas]|uniref:murein hydrolase activator EnvC family protein n=1 Tax=unclassified Brevundimonas TaxID=2622653 RepID=UPI0025BA0746|nr:MULTISPECIES: peptidoglycan DD-metalloendopeptidase family protein [unclassified Brevundimonas]